MYAFLLAMIAVLLLIKKRETFFAVVVGGHKGISFDPYSQDGYELLNFKNTCPLDRPEEDAGLCYERCRPGYKGSGPVCWLETVNVGVGVPVGLAPCPSGWTNMGMTCTQPIQCGSVKSALEEGGKNFLKNPFSIFKSVASFFEQCSGGRTVGRLNPFCPDKYRMDPNTRRDRRGPRGWDGKPFAETPNGYDIEQSKCRISKEQEYTKTRGVCEGPGAITSEHPDYINGLCYRKCPEDKPFHVGGAPYLCSVGGNLSHTRGVGTIPPIVRINAGLYR